MPFTGRQELEGDVDALGLHVLGERDRHGARLGGIGEHPHRGEGDRIELLGALHPVEEPRERSERVGDLDADVVRLLELLQHGVGDPRREGVARQQQGGKAVGGGQRRTGQHVGGARPHGGGGGEGRAPTPHPCPADRLVHHRLLVARLMVREQTGPLVVQLLQRLPDSGDVAVPEDAVDAGDGALADLAVDRPLRGEELDERLGDRHAARAGVGHRGSFARYGRRGSTSWPSQVSLIHACAGSSLIFQTRTSSGPAMTFR
jgi:hypothetical protein